MYDIYDNNSFQIHVTLLYNTFMRVGTKMWTPLYGPPSGPHSGPPSGPPQYSIFLSRRGSSRGSIKGGPRFVPTPFMQHIHATHMKSCREEDEEEAQKAIDEVGLGTSFSGVSLEAGYRPSTAAYIASHHRLLNLTFKRVVVVISRTETGRNNYESLYFIL